MTDAGRQIPDEAQAVPAAYRGPRLSPLHKMDAGWAGGRLGLVILVGWAVRIAWLWYFPLGVRSHDMTGWWGVADAMARGDNPYNATPYLNYPPLWMQVLYALRRVADTTGVSLGYLVPLLLVVTETGVILVTWRILRRWATPARAARYLLVGISLNPAAHLLVVQHANFDPLLALWIVLAVERVLAYLDHAGPGDVLDWLLACLFVGIGILTKIGPLLLLPLLALGARRLPFRALALGAALVFGPAALGLSVIFVLGPEQVTAHVLRYRSIQGWFGITGLLGVLGFPAAMRAYAALAPPALLAGVAGLTVYLFRRRAPAPEPNRVVLLATTILLAAVTFGPGYGTQYVYWFLPLLVAVAAAFGARFRRLCLACWAVASVTLLFEYAVQPVLGQYASFLYPSEAVREFGRRMCDPTATTLLRIPLFGAHLALLVGSVHYLGRESTEPA